MSTRIWQGWDDDGNFGAIPASPLLLPALILWLIAPLLVRLFQRPGPMPRGFNLQEYRRNRESWLALRHNPGACPERWAQICHPSWAKPGQVWTYPEKL